MSNLGRSIVYLGLGAMFIARLVAQGPRLALPHMLGFQVTGTTSAWAWGKDLSAPDMDTRRFHLWHLSEGKVAPARLPRELATPVEDTYPGVCFLDDQHGFVVWTPDPLSENNEVRFTLAVAETVDGGRSWQVRRERVSPGFTFTGVNQVQFTDNQNGHVIVGRDGAMGSTFKTLLHTRDGGGSWELDPASRTVVGDEDAPIYMNFRSRSDGWILTAGVHGQPYPNIGLSRTTDGGRDWHLFDKFVQPAVCRPDCSVQNVSPIYADPSDLRDGFFVVSFWYTPTGTYPVEYLTARYRTHDGGATWSGPEELKAPGSNRFSGSEFGLAQDGSRIFLTSDVGRAALSHILAPHKSSLLKNSFIEESIISALSPK